MQLTLSGVALRATGTQAAQPLGRLLVQVPGRRPGRFHTDGLPPGLAGPDEPVLMMLS